MANLRISVLAENTVRGKGLLAEHGWALWIEAGDKKILFDTGQGKVLHNNACALGIDPGKAAAVVLSHGHYDHTGGLCEVLQRNGDVPVYAHSAALNEKYSRHFDGSVHEIGMPSEAKHKANFVFNEGPVEIFPGFHLTGAVPRLTDYEDTGGDFYLDRECKKSDPVTDDQAAFIETPDGLVVILGCAHSGVINILDYIRKLTGNTSIHTVVGGMHLVNALEARIDKTVSELKKLCLRGLMPSHCTGFAASARLAWEFSGAFRNIHVASVIEMKI